MARYRLLAGIHSDRGNTYTPDPPDNVIESEIDLVARFGKNKFERLHTDEVVSLDGIQPGGDTIQPGPVAVAPAAQDIQPVDAASLEGMSLTELREIAEEEEVDLPPKATKQQLIAAIQQAKTTGL